MSEENANASMSPAPSNGGGAGAELIVFNSTYEHGMDAKRRVQIPAKWLPGQGTVEFSVFVWGQGEGTEDSVCLLVLTREQIAGLMAKLRGMSLGDPNAVTLRRLLGSQSDQVVVDSAGRICLPEKLSKEAGIGKKAVLVGLMDCFQIWDPARLDFQQKLDKRQAVEARKLI